MSRPVEPLPGMIGRHRSMAEVYRRARAAARSDVSVTIVGESGTGKELVARAVHGLSPQAAGPFIAVNCAALPESLAESELFGCERGAFTGAVHPRPGLLERADGGTLFLDEVCSMPVGVQAKLLRAIELGEIRRVGASDERSATFRVVAAVSEPVESLIRSRRLRRDFAYRLAAIRIVLPPLRHRGGDVAALARHFLQTADGTRKRRLSADALRFLERHRWPGNVRELRSTIQSALLLSEGELLEVGDVLEVLGDGGLPRSERHELRATLEANDWNVSQTARLLGIARSTLYHWLAEQGIARPEAGSEKCPIVQSLPSDRTVLAQGPIS